MECGRAVTGILSGKGAIDMEKEAIAVVLGFSGIFITTIMACLGGIMTILLSFRKESREEFKSLKETFFSHRHRTDGSVRTKNEQRAIARELTSPKKSQSRQ